LFYLNRKGEILLFFFQKEAGKNKLSVFILKFMPIRKISKKEKKKQNAIAKLLWLITTQLWLGRSTAAHHCPLFSNN